MEIPGIDKKVALILSGAVRNLEDTWYSIKYHIVDKFDNLDVFFYGCENIKGREQNYDLIMSKFNPKKVVINPFDFYTDEIGSGMLTNKFNNSPNYCKRPIWSSYNLMMCNNLKKDFQNENNFEYDLVIRSRTDLFWFREFNTQELELAKSNIVLPWDWAFRSGHPWNGPNNFGYSDIYAISNNQLFDYYANVYHSIKEFSDLYPYHTESVLGYYLREKPVVEVKRHVLTEYPIFERMGLDSNGEPLPENFYHPKIWYGEKDFGTTNINLLGGLRVRYDCDERRKEGYHPK